MPAPLFPEKVSRRNRPPCRDAIRSVIDRVERATGPHDVFRARCGVVGRIHTARRDVDRVRQLREDLAVLQRAGSIGNVECDHIRQRSHGRSGPERLQIGIEIALEAVEQRTGAKRPSGGQGSAGGNTFDGQPGS